MDIKEILEKALRGRAVVLRNGRKGYVRHVEKKLAAKYPVIGFIERSDGSLGGIEWALNGRILTGGAEWPFDIIGLAPLEFGCWHLFDERVAAITKDSDGKWWAHEEIPEYDPIGWCSYGFVYSIKFLKVDFPDCDWQDSLIVRPVNGDSE